MKAVIVARDSRAVVLTVPCEEFPASAPALGGVIYSLVRSSGTPETAFIELEARGIPASFSGDTWQAEWIRMGSKRELRIGFPDVFFSAAFDAPVRIQVDAVSAGFAPMRLGTLAIDVAIPSNHESREWPAWVPALES